MMIYKKNIFALLLMFSFILPVYAQENLEPVATKEELKEEPKTQLVEVKKITKRPKVKYRDINIARDIRKEIYLDFPISENIPPRTTNTNVYELEVNRMADDPLLKKDRIVLKGKNTGITDMWVYDNQDILRVVYNVTVTDVNLKRALGFLKQEFKNIEGLKMYIREKRVVLDGEILLPQDIARIHQVLGGGDYPVSIFKVQYRLSPSLYKIVAKKMEEEIGLPTVQVDVVNERFVLKGEVRSDEQLEDVVFKAVLYLPKYFYNPHVGDPTASGEMTMPAEGFRDKPIIDYFLKVIEPEKPISKVVKVAVYFVELAKGFEDSFGFNWSPSLKTDGSEMKFEYSSPPKKDEKTGADLAGMSTTITGIITNFIPKLQDAVKNNRGRVIQSAAITIEDKQSGKIAKTTKYPYIVQTENSITTQTADVGITIDLTPSILNDAQKSDDLNLKIGIDVSQVVGKSDTSIPITSQSGVSTVINLKSGETAAIGGIVQSSVTKAYADGSGDENVIISLSRSKSFTKGKSQFVVFITPIILNTASEGSDSVKEKFRVK